MAGRFAPILSKTRDQLISDIEAGNILNSSGHLDMEATLLYFNQLNHLEANDQAQQMLDLTVEIRDLTRTIRLFTVVVVVLTLVNVALVAYTLFCPGVAHG